ncbi:hypothetical protein ACIQZI_18805 [Peribacillus sp. NPDC096379]|uniref:hypothetical protein n=1 Tax=Peribacillus sp. NPDC096379 TaxID=3364393 RepID=UPI00380EEB50
MVLNKETDFPNVKKAKFQFIFPFMLEEHRIEEFVNRLIEKDFDFFDLNNAEQQQAYYGESHVSHRSLESFFLPNIEPILFPQTDQRRESFRRFSKRTNLTCEFSSNHLETDFIMDSIDIFICPFHIGLINIRVSLPEGLSYSDVLFFGDRFRVLEQISNNEENAKIGCEEETYQQVKDFIFNKLLQDMSCYIDESKIKDTYFGSLPFFVDERMYVFGHLSITEDSELSKSNLFRAGELNGYDSSGNPYLGALNSDYIDRYYTSHVYDRWGGETYYVTSENHFVCLTKTAGDMEEELISQMHGQLYYSLLFFFYYKIVLLKLSHQHSLIDIEKDKSRTEELIVMITNFSAKFYFPEVNSTTTGREISQMTKDIFQIERLYQDVKETLYDLYQSQDKLSGKRQNALLQILTIYTVISGIFGMNLVIEDGKENFSLSKFMSYTPSELFVFFVTMSGVIISLIIGVYFLKEWIREHKSRNNKIF